MADAPDAKAGDVVIILLDDKKEPLEQQTMISHHTAPMRY